MKNDEMKLIIERLTRKRVIRKGQVKIKYVTDKEGYKVEVDPRTGAAHERRLTPQEIRKYRIAAKRRSRKLAGKKNMIAMKRRLSMNKRKSWS